MRIYNKPLTARVKLVLLVVNSVKLHLTALKRSLSFVLSSFLVSGPLEEITDVANMDKQMLVSLKDALHWGINKHI